MVYYMKVHVNLEIRVGIKSLNIQLNSFCKIYSPSNLKICKKVYMSVNTPHTCVLFPVQLNTW